MSDVEFRRLAKELAGKQRSSSSVLLLLVVTLIVVIFVWTSVTELDNVVRGSGKTISEAKNQLVQSSEPGVIRARYIEEGDIVKKGQLLFDIDPIEAKTQLDQAQKRFSSLTIKSIRLKAEVEEVFPSFSDDLLETSPNTISTELALYKARLDDLNIKSAILEQRRIQKLNEIQELKINFDTASNGLALIRREIATLEPLVRSGLAPETRLLALKRDEEKSVGKANSAESGQKRLVSGLDEISEQLKAEQQSYKTVALTDLSSIEIELAELKARIPALESRVERTSVRSPVDGVVNRVNYVTADAYISIGEILSEIVPTGSDLIVETKIDPKDIGDIVEGQDVKISLTAFDPNKYGRIDGKVISISADAITETQAGQQFYHVNVSISGALYEDNGDEVVILPGMVASIDVLSGKRTILDYFWQPVAATRDKALRD
jgi:adhesin transport system membrane fusion protein